MFINYPPPSLFHLFVFPFEVDHLEILWAEANYEPIKDSNNNDRELERFEFIEIIIRLAFEHFVSKEVKHNHSTGNISKNDKSIVDHLEEAIIELVEHHILPQAWRSIPHARYFADPDAFRRERLYNETINKVLLSKCDELYSLFCAYANGTKQREGNVVGGEHSPTLVGYREFIDMCRNSNLIGAVKETGGITKDKKKDGEFKNEQHTSDNSSLKNCRIAFALSQMTVVDELSRSSKKLNRDSNDHATFVEFLEAIVRLTDMNSDPKGNDPKYQLSASLIDVLNQIVNEHDKINFWSKVSGGNNKRLWREYKKKFGQSRNTVKRRGFGPEVGKEETINSSNEVLRRRALSTEGVFAIGNISLHVLSRKYTGGISTRLEKEKLEEIARKEEEVAVAAAKAKMAQKK